MSVINFYLGLIAAAMAVRYHRVLALSRRGRKSATEAWAKESKKGRETREKGGPPAATVAAAALLYPYTTLHSFIPFGVPQEP